MFFSKPCTYGIQAMIYLSTLERDKYVSITNIAETLNLSSHFLTKILQPLTQAGYLSSYKGPNGGVLLSKEPKLISLYDIVAVLDKVEKFTSCLLGFPDCGSAKPCPFHEEWFPIRNKLHSECISTTLEELAKKSKEGQYRFK